MSSGFKIYVKCIPTLFRYIGEALAFGKFHRETRHQATDNTGQRARSTLDSTITILLVEDDEAGRISIAGLLRRAGYAVHVAPDYRRALALLESKQPIDVMITDIVMPDRVNGLALARMARLRRPGIKLLYITGYDILGLATEALGPVVRKPFADEKFLNAVSSSSTAN